jgi:hypothetical protein
MGQQIAFSSAPFGKPGSDDFRQIGTLTDKSTVQWGPTLGDQAPDHPPTVLSVRPDGTYKTEPLDRAGPWEVVKFDGSCLTIRPNHGEFGGWPNLGIVIAARTIS